MYGSGDQYQQDAETIRKLKKEIKELKDILQIVAEEVELPKSTSMLIKRAIK